MTDLPWEDNLLERKPESDLGDLLKTCVAFANSVKPGHVATVLIGELDNGTAQGVKNPDQIQKKVRETCDKIYPPIVWRSIVYEKDELPCVRVEIEYDGETPHFGGAAWVRRGSETIKATDAIFQRLIDFRSSKVRILAEWLDKQVVVFADSGIPVSIAPIPFAEARVHPRWSSHGTSAILRSVNGFWATFELKNELLSEPLDKITLSWSDAANCLKVLVKI